MSTSTARVLKGGGAAGVRPAVLSTVEELIAQPRRHGHGPLQEALAAATEQGYRDGHAQGAEAGRRAGQEQAMREFTELLTPALRALEGARAELSRRDAVSAEELEAQLLAMAVDVAEALVGRELATVDAPALDAVRRALALAPQRGAVVVHLHPGDLEVVQAAPSVAPGRTVELVADPAVERGGAVVRVGACTIDGQLSTALTRVRVALGLDPADEARGAA